MTQFLADPGEGGVFKQSFLQELVSIHFGGVGLLYAMLLNNGTDPGRMVSISKATIPALNSTFINFLVPSKASKLFSATKSGPSTNITGYGNIGIGPGSINTAVTRFAVFPLGKTVEFDIIPDQLGSLVFVILAVVRSTKQQVSTDPAKIGVTIQGVGGGLLDIQETDPATGLSPNPKKATHIARVENVFVSPTDHWHAKIDSKKALLTVF